MIMINFNSILFWLAKNEPVLILATGRCGLSFKSNIESWKNPNIQGIKGEGSPQRTQIKEQNGNLKTKRNGGGGGGGEEREHSTQT